MVSGTQPLVSALRRKTRSVLRAQGMNKATVWSIFVLSEKMKMVTACTMWTLTAPSTKLQALVRTV